LKLVTFEEKLSVFSEHREQHVPLYFSLWDVLLDVLFGNYRQLFLKSDQFQFLFSTRLQSKKVSH